MNSGTGENERQTAIGRMGERARDRPREKLKECKILQKTNDRELERGRGGGDREQKREA